MRNCRSQRAAIVAVVRDQHQRRAGLAVQLEHQLHHRLAGGEVQAAGGFVGQQHGRAHDEGARQRHALLLAAGQHLGVVLQSFGQAHAAQHLGGRARARRRGPSVPAAASRFPAPSGCPAAGSSGRRSRPGATAVRRARPRRARTGRCRPARTVPEVGVSRPATIDSSVLLPEPEAPTMATDSRGAQREIDVMENGQRPGGIGHLLGDALRRR